MIVDIVRYPGHGRDYRAYVFRRQASHTSPGILLLHDRWGVTPEMESLAARLAHTGYAVMLPDLYNGRRPSSDEEARQWMYNLGLAEGQEEVRLALAWLRNQAYTTVHRTAVIGFEHFGTLGLLAATLPKFPPVAVIAFYAPVGQVIAHVSSMRSAIQAHFAGKDKHVPMGDVDAFRTTLERAGITHEVYVYEDAQHDFMRPGSTHYSPDEAKRAWERTLAFLAKHLQEPVPTPVT